MRAAIFLDRDGTLIEDRGHLRGPADVVFYPDTIPALRLLQHHFRLFIVTNQPGIAEGVIAAADVENVHRGLLEQLARCGIRIEHAYYCPHRRTDGCACIKPNPHFLQQAARDYAVDLRQSFTIGDHPHDVEFARAAGATGIYVLTGHGADHRADLPPDAPVASGIWEAALLVTQTRWTQHGQAALLPEIRHAAGVVRSGGVVAFPTETVYGLGASALDAAAVARVFEIKRRPRFDPLIVHVAQVSQAESLVTRFPEPARELAQRFWPGPLTIVLPKSAVVPDIVTAGLPTVAVRMPDHPVALTLIHEAGVPLAGPSANPFGYISPTTADHVRAQLGNTVDQVLDGGACRIGVESTVVSFVDDPPALLRPGGLPVEDIERIVGPVQRSRQPEALPTSPGQLPRHYAPRTPFVFGAVDERAAAGKRVGLLSLGPVRDSVRFQVVEVLSAAGDLREAAANLFAALRRLDGAKLDLIVAAPVPDVGLGLAINDRLRRAAAGWEGGEVGR